MAQLIVDGDDVVVKLTTMEKLCSFHTDVRVPFRSVRRIRTPTNAWLTIRGWRVTGISLPGYVSMGRRRHGSGYDFTVIYKDRPTVVLECNGSEFGEVVVGVDDAAATAAQLAAAAGISLDPTP